MTTGLSIDDILRRSSHKQGSRSSCVNGGHGMNTDSGAHEEFDALIASFSASDNAAERAVIRDTIWERFGTSGTTFISDMANFSSTSRALGICHFLKLIHRTREFVAPIIESNNGTLLKCDADNCYAFFKETDDALQASFDVNAELFRNNQDNDLENHIYLSIGIDHGKLLLVGNDDYYGDPVNTASKLGEDLASKNEMLVTERALEQSTHQVSANAERMVARISDIEISYVRLLMNEAAAG